MSSEKLPLLDSIEPTDSRTQEGMFLRMFAKLIGFFFGKKYLSYENIKIESVNFTKVLAVYLLLFNIVCLCMYTQCRLNVLLTLGVLQNR